MRFTESRDGVPRTTMYVAVRLTAEEVNAGSLAAKALGYTSLRKYLAQQLRAGIRSLLAGQGQAPEQGSRRGETSPYDEE